MKKILSGTVCFVLAAALLAAFPIYPANAAGTGAEVRITAPAAIVIDYDTGDILYAKDIDTLRVPASMTKIMTAYIVFEEIESGNLAWDSLMTVSANAAAKSRDENYPMTVPLTSGGSYSVDQLMRLIMVPSASASCVVIAENISGTEAAFVERMNETASRMGIDARYINSHGAQPHYITARGIATLIRNFIREYPDILYYTSLQSISFNGVTYNNTNRLLPSGLNAYPGTDGFKTGTIPEAGYCHAASVLRNGHRLISVVMGATDIDSRNTDAIAILDYGFREIAKRDEARADLRLTFSGPSEIRLGADFNVVVGVTGIDYAYQASDAVFTVNGAQVKAFGESRIENGSEFALTCFIPENSGGTADIGFTLAFSDGSAAEVSDSIAISGKAPSLYRDIDKHWLENEIAELTGAGILQGDGTGYFRPSNAMTRAMFVSTLSRVAAGFDIDADAEVKESLLFADVQQGAWYYDCASWACSIGLVDGFGATFKANEPINRELAAAILYRFLYTYGISYEDTDSSDDERTFTDSDSISTWAFSTVMEIVRAGLMTGYSDGSFKPAGILTRAEAASVIYRMMNLVAVSQE